MTGSDEKAGGTEPITTRRMRAPLRLPETRRRAARCRDSCRCPRPAPRSMNFGAASGVQIAGGAAEATSIVCSVEHLNGPPIEEL